MKLIALISCLPAATHAFQHAATAVHYKKRMETTRLDFYPENFDRAEKCATHVGSCGIDEIQQLAQGDYH